MKLVSYKANDEEQGAIEIGGKLIPLLALNDHFHFHYETTVFSLLEKGQYESLKNWYVHEGKEALANPHLPFLEEWVPAPLYRHPRKIWGIGMNYRKGDEDQFASNTVAPVSFMKPDTSLIGPEDLIQIPPLSNNTTAEAELALVIGKTCKEVSEADALDYVAGVAAALDMTEADIHAENLRYLTRAKSFNTFFSFGSELVSLDEYPCLDDIYVTTLQNGEEQHTNRIGAMRYNLAYIVSFHSEVMTLLPGDILLTGTPGAVVLRDGAVVACRISGFSKQLENRAINKEVHA
ncbi:fumarylacetoacetate hydrolase family protein [Shouchella lehensis]|uniref:FAA hydrolase family protein n=1 Tax=Shouchella lehensis TaxID=300825 RepID=A0A4Y7WMV4_9BACI|nr:fumarylacetoacetate hydrolase family protein [Shouchella lehensis]MBG9782947.1 hypothetical protein [Shouchella lehensis]RQW22844.1 FAA hydrolase family protein [Bacillus sp. C1-1]TES49697.1 FAA hydrolase family protein [Shouchella lehensis]